jgi:hypothetical protein
MTRILAITGLVGLLGGLAGALGGAVALAAGLLLLDTELAGSALQDVLPIAATVGFAVGGLFAPVSTWLFLRRVPLWRAGSETAFVAALGFTLALMLSGGLPVASAAGVAGALAAGARLKYAFRDRSNAALVDEEARLPSLPRG